MRYSKPPPESLDTNKIEELRRRREKLGLSKRDLEERLGLSDRMVSKWEAGTRSPTAGNLDRWCAALGLKLTFRPR